MGGGTPSPCKEGEGRGGGKPNIYNYEKRTSLQPSGAEGYPAVFKEQHDPGGGRFVEIIARASGMRIEIPQAVRRRTVRAGLLLSGASAGDRVGWRGARLGGGGRLRPGQDGVSDAGVSYPGDAFPQRAGLRGAGMGVRGDKESVG